MPATMEPDTIDVDFAPRRRDDLTSVEVDGEAVLYEPRGGGVHRLDRLATVLWNCFDGSATIRELGNDLAEVFSEPQHRLREDVLNYVRALGREGLLAGVDPGEGAGTRSGA